MAVAAVDLSNNQGQRHAHGGMRVHGGYCTYSRSSKQDRIAASESNVGWQIVIDCGGLQ
jgi:hypothetical protein